jgi:hypothetical protein
MRESSSLVWAISAGSLAYATLRYNVFKGVAWSDWPSFVLNKSLAMSGLLLLVAWVVRARRSDSARHAGLLNAASRTMLAHILLSVVLLTPVYFPALFRDGRLTGLAGLAVIIGIAAAGGLSVSAPAAVTPGDRRPAAGAVAFAAGCHAALFGYSSWLVPSSWPGHLPPITLVSFAAGVVGLAAGLGGRSSPPAGPPGRSQIRSIWRT